MFKSKTMSIVLLLGFVIIIMPLQYLLGLAVASISFMSVESELKERVVCRSGVMDRC